MKRFLLVVVLAAAAAFAVWFGMRSRVLSASSNAAVSALLPKETLALVHLPDFNRAREEWRRTDIYQLWREPALQDFLQKPLANVAMSDRVKQNLQEIETIGMRDAFLALTAVRDGRPEIAGGFHFDGTSSAAERVIGKWRRALQLSLIHI